MIVVLCFHTKIPSSTLKKDKVAVTFVSTGFPPLLISKKMLYGNATLKYF